MDARAAMRDIVHLADDIGPREATSRNFAEAAAFVETRFERLGYHVRRTNVRVPAGNSWGTPVRRGTSVNVIAQPKGFDTSEPYVVLGAHRQVDDDIFDHDAPLLLLAGEPCDGRTYLQASWAG